MTPEVGKTYITVNDKSVTIMCYSCGFYEGYITDCSVYPILWDSEGSCVGGGGVGLDLLKDVS